ncbi:MAG: LysR family transcriptional regulator [Chloroflexi bacterium]|nr:LysR family transcriptional regulator [Chloroflexota bacterium]
MNFSQLQSFVALAETESFTDAAYTVNLTQSAVSHALAALENELGITLIERNRKGVVALTNVGQKIIPHVRALLAQAEAIEQEARASQKLAMGRLRLGSIASLISPSLLAGVLTVFRQQFPDIEVVLFEGTMQEVGEWIENNIIDVGFAFIPSDCLENVPVMTDELCVLLPAGHPLGGRTAVTPNELGEEGFIMANNECTLRFLELAGFRMGKPSIRYQATDSGTILAMVREGLGITLLPRMMLPPKLEGIVALPLEPPQKLTIGLVLNSPMTAAPNTKLFIQTALDWMAAQ